MYYRFLLIGIVALVSDSHQLQQQQQQQLQQQQVQYPYCFRFTWIGPYLDKNNIGGLTCEHLREDLNTVPCRRPLVATDNDRIPNTVNMWREYEREPNLIGCPMTPGYSCVKYSYIYKGGIQNITYMCAKVNISNGCYTQRYISGLEVEVCVCESLHGRMPCNAASGRCHQRDGNLLLLAIAMGFIFCLINKIS